MNAEPSLAESCRDIDSKGSKSNKSNMSILKLIWLTLFTYNILFIYQLIMHFLIPSIKISRYNFITNPYICLTVNIAACLILYRHNQLAKQIDHEVARRWGYEQALQQIKHQLAQQMAERTADLEKVNQGLRLEIRERERAEGDLRTSEENYRLLVNKMPAVVFKGYMDWTIDFFDDKIEELTGYPKADFDARKIRWSQVILEEDLLPAKEQFLKSLHTDKVCTREYRIRHKSGRILWIQARGQIFCDQQGRAEYVSGVFFDITKTKQAEEALHEANERLTRLVEEASRQNRTMNLLNDMSELLQNCLTAEEAYTAVGIYAPKLFPEDSGALYVFDDSRDFLVPAMLWGKSPPADGLFPASECWALRCSRTLKMDGTEPQVPCQRLSPTGCDRYLCVPMSAHGESLGIFHVRVETQESANSTKMAQPLTEFQQWAAHSLSEHLGISLSNLKLRRSLLCQAIRDPLTGLFNRCYLEETMEREWIRARRLGLPLGVILLNIDHLTNINESLGQGGGEAVLAAVGSLIKNHISEEDVPCRYDDGGFLVILPGSSLKAAQEFADTFRKEVEQLHLRVDTPFCHPISISQGIAVLPDHGSTVAEIIDAVELALYQAKRAGRGRIMAAQRIQPQQPPASDRINAVR